MRKPAVLMIATLVLATSLGLTGCHKLGLVKSAPKKPAASKTATSTK